MHELKRKDKLMNISGSLYIIKKSKKLKRLHRGQITLYGAKDTDITKKM